MFPQVRHGPDTLYPLHLLAKLEMSSLDYFDPGPNAAYYM